MRLYAGEWWTSARTREGVAEMLAESDLVFAVVHRPTDQLVAFARVLTDGVYLAHVLDVIVVRDSRGSGLGVVLMDAILDHPRLATVASIELVCQPNLVPFYSRWGFTDDVGNSRLMRRTSDPLLMSPSNDD